MSESAGEMIKRIGANIHGPGFGPTLDQYNVHCPPGALTGLTLYAAIVGHRPDVPPKANLRKAQWLEILKVLNLSYPPRKKQKRRDQFTANSTGAPVEFIYGRAQDSVLHTKRWDERTIWHPGLRREVTVEIAMVISGERLRPLPEFVQ